MRVLLALPLAFSFHLRACEDQLPALPGGIGGASPAPTAPGPHSGALVTAGGRPIELVARNDGTLEIYGMSQGPQALAADWPVSAQVTIAGDATRIVSLHYRPEAARFEGTVAGAQPGRFRVGYVAEGKTNVAEGTLAQVLPPGPPVPAAPSLANAVPPAEEPANTAAGPDAGTASAAAAEAPVAAAEAPVAEDPTPGPTASPTPSPTPAPTATPTRTASTMRATSTTEHRSSGSGFSSRRHNRR